MPKWNEHICTESVSPILPLHVTVYCRGQPCWKLRQAISTRGSFSWSIVYCCSCGFKLNSCMILLGFKMSYPESAEDTVQINILAPRCSLWDHEHLIFYCWEVGLKYSLFLMTGTCSYSNTVSDINGECVGDLINLFYAVSSQLIVLCFSPVL